MAGSHIPDRIDWSSVRLLTIEDDEIRLLTDAGETSFHFDTEEQLRDTLYSWTNNVDSCSESAERTARLKR